MSEMPTRRPATHTIALVLAILYGCASISGGIWGYATKGSVASVIAGSVAGILLLVCAAVILSRPMWGLMGAGIISIALLGRFLPALVKSLNEGEQPGSWAIVISAGGVLVLLSCALALASRSGSSGGCCGK